MCIPENMKACFKLTQQERKSSLWNTVVNLLWILFWLFVFLYIWHYALKSDASGKFVVSFAEAIAWPSVLLILVGYRYRVPLTRFIDELKSVETSAAKITRDQQRDQKEKKKLIALLDHEKDSVKKKRIEILALLPLESLRLLGIVIAMGTRRELDLSLYTNSRARWLLPYRPAKQLLLDEGLIEQDGRFYRPTKDGIEVFSLHLDIIKEEVEQ